MKTAIQFKSRKIDITPVFPCRLTGMEKGEVHKGIHSQLEVNAMIFSQGSKSIFIISIDTLFVSNEIKAFLSEEINKKFGARKEVEICLLSTHTHYAPSLENERIKLGQKDQEYYSFLREKLSELLDELSECHFNTVSLKIGKGRTEHLTANRRRRARILAQYFKPSILMEPNLRGFKDEQMIVINIHNTSTDDLLGTLWTFPCHLTNLFEKHLISSEFPGRIRDSIRNQVNKRDMSIVYLPGFAGDIRAYPPKRRSFMKAIRDLLQFSYPVDYYRFINEEEYDRWINALQNAFWGANKNHETIDENTGFEISMLKESLANLGLERVSNDELIFRKISFGDELAIYFISAEVVSYYTKILDGYTTEKHRVYTGYSDDVFGYLPTNKQIKEGGYEGGGYFEAFRIKGKFSSDVEQTIGKCIQKINSSM